MEGLHPVALDVISIAWGRGDVKRGLKNGGVGLFRFGIGFVLGFVLGLTPGFPPGLKFLFPSHFFYFPFIGVSPLELLLLFLQSLGVSRGRYKVLFLVPAIGMNLGSLGRFPAGLPFLTGQTVAIEIPVRGWGKEFTVLGG